MTVVQVAEALRRHPEVIREWIRDGRLRGEKYGPTWMVSDQELARFKKNQPGRRRRVHWFSQSQTKLFHATIYGLDRKPLKTMFCGAIIDPSRSRDVELTSGIPKPACRRCLRIVERDEWQ